MKVTIITNGGTKLVLKPETQMEILAVKEMSTKPIIAKYLEKTQVLEESTPDCLVISPCKEPAHTLPSSFYGVYDNNAQNQCIGLIPNLSSYDDILSFIREITNSDEAQYHQLPEHENVPVRTDEVFKVILKKRNVSTTREYSVGIAVYHSKW